MLNIIADELPRFMQCNGSRLMPAAPTTVENDPTQRDEGIAAHWLATQFFNGVPPETLIDRKAPNGVYVSKEMHDYVDAYLCALDCGEMEVDTSWGDGVTFRVGSRADHIKFRAPNPVDPMHPEPGILTIDEFKYGWGIVEAFEHWPSLNHAIGYCINNQLAPTEVVIRIHQPRPNHPDGKLREWRLTGDEFAVYWSRLAHVLQNPSDLVQTGPLCGKCPALGHCPAGRKSGYNAIDAADKPLPDAMTDAELESEYMIGLVAQTTLNNRVEALQEMMLHRCKANAIFENFYTEDRFGDRAWLKGLDANMLSAMTGKDLRTEPKAVTPAEAIRRGVPEAVVAAMSKRPMIGKKLTRGTHDQRAKRQLKKGK